MHAIRYDPEKAAADLRKHGVSFADAEGVFSDPLAGTREDPDAAGENRYVAIGLATSGVLLVVVFTQSRKDPIDLCQTRHAKGAQNL